MNEEKSQSKLIAKIEELAGMKYDDIQYIVKDDEQYPIEAKSLEQIIFDLDNNATACPF